MRSEPFGLGDVTVKPALNAIARADGHIRLEPRVMSVLVLLATRAGEVLGKEEIFSAVWDGAAVSDDALVRCIAAIRKALGDDPRAPRIIETISKKGYRLVAPVQWDLPAHGCSSRPGLEISLQRILASCTDHVYIYDVDGRYLYASEAGARALGLAPSQMTGKSWRELGMPADILEPFERSLHIVLSKNETVTERVVYPTIDGERHYQYVLDPIAGDNGTPMAVMAVVRDITEFVR